MEEEPTGKEVVPGCLVPSLFLSNSIHLGRISIIFVSLRPMKAQPELGRGPEPVRERGSPDSVTLGCRRLTCPPGQTSSALPTEALHALGIITFDVL